jgi:hypothetical protein
MPVSSQRGKFPKSPLPVSLDGVPRGQEKRKRRRPQGLGSPARGGNGFGDRDKERDT